ncbi:PTS system, glucose subfamily, IIA component [Lachnospiraceae bacterium 10-1]|nr:PTS system, glucose subfamily, IIA component [Lachnospiraceae bacterium 10-1]
MDAKKRERYEKISIELTKLVGGKENIQGVAHCATRLRIVLKDNELADLKAIENVDLAKGVFVAGDQVQIIFGAGLVNDVYEVFAEHNNMKNMSLSDLKTVANKKMNPLQRMIKALSDVFVDIMPGILAAALLTGLSGVLGNLDFVKANDTLFGINRLINISSGAIFGFLPLAVAYSACKRFGGRPILGIVMGCIMLSDSLANAYAAAQGTVEATTLHIFGLGVDLVGFQGGIIVALLMGFVTARLDIFFEKKVPEVIRLLLSPLLTTLVGALLLFTIIGPVGRGLSSGITNGLVWMTQNLGVVGYAVFSGLQQLVVITGLHHIFGAIEAQLLADTGRISVLFGITEPALFGINLRYRFPIIGGCIGGALGGVVVYFTNLAAVGFGTTVLPGIALADPSGNGYVNYIIAHMTAIAGGFIMTLLLGRFMDKTPALETVSEVQKEQMAEEVVPEMETLEEEVFFGYAKGRMIAMEDMKNETFANKILGDGVAVIPEEGKVYAPTDGTILNIFDTKHAVCFANSYGTEILIHIGVDTVNLKGKYFMPHVKDGDVVKKGQLLVEFDKEQIEKAGYDTSIPMIFTDLPEEKRLEVSVPGEMTVDTKTAIVYKA